MDFYPGLYQEEMSECVQIFWLSNGKFELGLSALSTQTCTHPHPRTYTHTHIPPPHTHSTQLASPVISSALQRNETILNTSDFELNTPVKITLTHHKDLVVSPTFLYTCSYSHAYTCKTYAYFVLRTSSLTNQIGELQSDI